MLKIFFASILFVFPGDSFKLGRDSVDNSNELGETTQCERRAHLSDWQDDPCPCFCGTGTTTSRRECVWYEQTDDGSCEERRTDGPGAFHICGRALMTKEKDCYNGTCLINLVSEQTQDVYEAGSNSDFYYEAYTLGGQICDIGKLDLPDYNDRQRGKIDTYYLSMPCNACMKSSTEIFDKLKVTIHGTDGWKAAWILVEVNGNNGTYFNPEWLDSNGSLIYDDNYTKQPKHQHQQGDQK
ncbi:uncharacterized protein LOC134846262 [Symsagittifera roscoffensis]|uniref:uncharacterized protein LOC134846262 n=1 Tax=Symsagittifera roscoffensis TaxID=84072 RepID=UPI00307C46F8